MFRSISLSFHPYTKSSSVRHNYIYTFLSDTQLQMKSKRTISKKEQDIQSLEKLFPQEGATEVWSIYKTSGYSTEKAIKQLCRGDRHLYDSKMEEYKQSRVTKNTTTQTEEETPKKTGKTADEVYNRLQWDRLLNKQETIIGYEDRFIGIQEIAYELFE
ncbi:hypothetical protein PROFUN_02708 [Planoprotostelium fungivorum]|uniref:MJ1316 RNA cyclic group end recognition domain-containing protein n=1 Tax=Planoprotostelium fungivorum TaxID=1890364 RepID=A0A2P6NVH5_9EUKA|nr:hypothetical protein PROFUN_02708 [Planoprotostelium fungivorum]